MIRGEIWLAQVGRKSRPVLVLTRTEGLVIAAAVPDGLVDGEAGPALVGPGLHQFLHTGVEFGRHRFLGATLVVAKMHGIADNQTQDADRPEHAAGHRSGSIVLDGEHDHRGDAQRAG